VTVDIPSYKNLMWPTLAALRELGGSASNAEINAAVIAREDFSEEQLNVLHNDGPLTEIEYRLAWARTYLKGMGLITNVSRGVWSLVQMGREVEEHQIDDLHRQYQKNSRKNTAPSTDTAAEPIAETEEAEELKEEQAWRETLLTTLKNMPPDAFERLAERLLRRAGFIETQVMGKTGDGGIDGMGVYRVSLVSFPVFFQCKRYKGSVGSPEIRDFRGAMSGRGDKGLFITTGTFTADAKAEATRQGAPPIDLIDGGRLCELLKEYELGVTTKIVQREDVFVDTAFFRDL
jgi:restriction system protein